VVEWWDAVFITWQIQFYNNWNALSGLTEDWVAPFLQVLADFLGSLAAVALYIPISGLHVLIDLLNQIISSLSGTINAVIDIGNSMFGLITNTFNGVLPSAWVALLGTILLLNIALRVYFFVKDISIAGFKI
jgi:hypothetical protein